MLLRYILAWFPMILIAIVNATIRETVYRKYWDDLLAHQISTITGIGLFSLYIWGLAQLWKLNSPQQALIIGLIWLLMTIAFEFLFGHYVVKQPWSALLADYNILKGRLWILVPIWITIAPWLFYRLQ